MTRQEIIKYTESLGGAVLYYPFENDFTSLAARHGGSGKWFALFMDVPSVSLIKQNKGKQAALYKLFENKKYIEAVNLKCDPVLLEILRNQFVGVMPGYHMNKKHWITVVLKSDVLEDKMKGLIEMSYDITRKGNGK